MSFRLASSSASAAASTSAASASSSAIRQPPSRLLSASVKLLQAPTPPPTLPRSHFLAKTPAPRTTLEAYRRYPNHPLNAFFQIKKTTLPNEDSAEGASSASPGEEVSLPVSLVPEDIGKDSSRRSWMAPELRRKSSVELHQLWYVLLMEMNRMGTKWEEIRRNGVRDLALQNDTNVRTRMLKLKSSMGRIKLVLNERRLALLSARSTHQAQLAQLALSARQAGEAKALAALDAETAERARLEDEAFEKMRQETEGAEDFSMGGEEGAGKEGVQVGVGRSKGKYSERW